MKRFTGHTERWGEFLDIKTNAAEAVRKDLSRQPARGVVLLGSVTDAYQNVEREFKITRSVLEVLLEFQFPVSILTKSDLVLRDIDLLTQFKNCEVGLTITTLDEQARKRFEPKSVSSMRRLRCLRILHENDIRTYAFIGPVLPLFTDLRAIYRAVSGVCDSIWVEALNSRCGNWEDIRGMLARFYPHLQEEFEEKAKNPAYWQNIGEELDKLSTEFCVHLTGYYRH